MNRRQAIMIGLVAVLAVLVFVDRFAPKGEGSGEGTSLREVYLQKAALEKKQLALLEQSDEWRRAHDVAQRRWSDVSDRVIVRPSVEIAQGELRERLTRLAQELGLPRPESRPLATITREGDSPVRVIQLSLDVTTEDWANAYRLIDRIETDPRMLATVTHLTLGGPGLPQMERELSVTLTVRAIAMVGRIATAGEGSS